MDWGDKENDLSTLIGSDTRMASEIVRDGSDNTLKFQPWIPIMEGHCREL
jgi:hypothetical protein